MPAYVIFIRERTLDPSELEAYARAAPPSLAPEGVAIAEFPSLEEAKDWYESPAYQAAAQHRLRDAIYRGIIVEGVSSEGRAHSSRTG
jgi:hypothetical protein